MLPKKLIPLLILLLSAALNTLSLVRYERFHPDEAFYMTFARNAAVNGDWWLTDSLDKPPLTMYLNALSLKFLAVDTDANGVFQLDVYKGEFAARATGVLVGVLLVAVIMALAKAMYHENRVAWIAGLLAALSPYTIAFTPTAFTDMPMLLFGVASMVAALKRKPAWSGVWFVLAFACKPQGAYFLPLVLAMSFQFSVFSSQSSALRHRFKLSTQHLALSTFWLPVLTGGALLFVWDAVRPGDSLFVLGAAHLAQDMHVTSELWLARLALWLEYGQYLAGDAVTTGVFFILAVLGGRIAMRPYRGYVLIFWLWLIGLTVFHIVSNFNLHDRYLLPAMPVFVLLVAKSLSDLTSRRPLYDVPPDTQVSGCQKDKSTEVDSIGSHQDTMSLLQQAFFKQVAGCFSFRRGRQFLNHLERGSQKFSPIFAALLLCVFALNLFSVPPIGSDRGDYRGIDTLANYLNAKPVATVIYDRWLTWEMGYYMGQWTDKRRVYYPTPEALQNGAAELRETGRRYFIAPDNVETASWLAALKQAGFTVELETQIERFRVYVLSPRS